MGEWEKMSISPLSPYLRYHPAMRKTRALFGSLDDPVGSPALYRLQLASPVEVQALLLQALDAILWVSGQQIVRLRMLDGENSIQGLLVLSNGCLCTLNLNANKHAVLAFEIHGQRGMLLYDDTDRAGIWLHPVSEPARNLWGWAEQCHPRTEEEGEFPSQVYVDRIWRSALMSLTNGKVWQEGGEAT